MTVLPKVLKSRRRFTVTILTLSSTKRAESPIPAWFDGTCDRRRVFLARRPMISHSRRSNALADRLDDNNPMSLLRRPWRTRVHPGRSSMPFRELSGVSFNHYSLRGLCPALPISRRVTHIDQNAGGLQIGNCPQGFGEWLQKN